MTVVSHSRTFFFLFATKVVIGEKRTTYTNDGKVFSFDLLDFDGGEIRITCFKVVAD